MGAEGSKPSDNEVDGGSSKVGPGAAKDARSPKVRPPKPKRRPSSTATRKLSIGAPTDFKHCAHIGSDNVGDATFQEDGQLKNTGAETPTGTARLMHMNTVPIQKPKDDKSAGGANTQADMLKMLDEATSKGGAKPPRPSRPPPDKKPARPLLEAGTSQDAPPPSRKVTARRTSRPAARPNVPAPSRPASIAVDYDMFAPKPGAPEGYLNIGDGAEDDADTEAEVTTGFGGSPSASPEAANEDEGYLNLGSGDNDEGDTVVSEPEPPGAKDGKEAAAAAAIAAAAAAAEQATPEGAAMTNANAASEAAAEDAAAAEKAAAEAAAAKAAADAAAAEAQAAADASAASDAAAAAENATVEAQAAADARAAEEAAAAQKAAMAAADAKGAEEAAAAAKAAAEAEAVRAAVKEKAAADAADAAAAAAAEAAAAKAAADAQAAAEIAAAEEAAAAAKAAAAAEAARVAEQKAAADIAAAAAAPAATTAADADAAPDKAAADSQAAAEVEPESKVFEVNVGTVASDTQPASHADANVEPAAANVGVAETAATAPDKVTADAQAAAEAEPESKVVEVNVGTAASDTQPAAHADANVAAEPAAVNVGVAETVAAGEVAVDAIDGEGIAAAEAADSAAAEYDRVTRRPAPVNGRPEVRLTTIEAKVEGMKSTIDTAQSKVSDWMNNRNADSSMQKLEAAAASLVADGDTTTAGSGKEQTAAEPSPLSSTASPVQSKTPSAALNKFRFAQNVILSEQAEKKTSAIRFTNVVASATALGKSGGLQAPSTEEDGNELEVLDPRAVEAANWTDKVIRQLIDEITTRGYVNADGQPEITFGQLFEETANIFDALSGICKTAKKYKVLIYEAEQLWQGQNDATKITLLKSTFDGVKVKRRRKADLVKSPAGKAAFGESLVTQNKKCHVCCKTVYQMEFVGASGLALHKNCFRCVDCNGVLKQTNYFVSVDGKFRCGAHHQAYEMLHM